MRPTVVLPLLVFALVATPARADDAPIVEHRPEPQAVGTDPLKIRAKIISVSGKAVRMAQVFVRVRGLESFSPLNMHQVKDAPDVFVAEIPRDLVDAQFEYYIEAYDADGNGPGTSGSAAKPHGVTLTQYSMPRTEPADPGTPQVTAAALPAAARPPAPVRSVEPAGPPRTLFFVLAGATCVAALAGSGLGWHASSLRSADHPSTVDGRTRHTLTQAQADSANGFATGANVSFGLAALLAAGAGVSFALDF